MPPFSEIAGRLGSMVEIPNDPEPEGYFVWGQSNSLEREQLTPAEKKARAIRECGKWIILKYNRLTGETIWGQFHCGYEQGCSKCFVIRQDRLCARLVTALHKGPVVMLELSQGTERTELLAALGKAHYDCIPGEQTDMIFANANHPAVLGHGRLLTEDDIDTLPWETLAVRATGRNTSGSLGQSAPLPAPLDDPEAVEVTTLKREIHALRENEDGTLTLPTKVDVQQVADESTLNTADLRPTDEKTLNEALVTRSEAAATAFRELGFTTVYFKDSWITEKLCLKKMDWSISLDKVRRRNSFALRQKAYQEAEKAF